MGDSGARYPSVIDLVDRARSGETAAREELCRQSYGYLRKVAHGRLDRRARGPLDTYDLIQITLFRAMRNLPGFRAAGEYAWFAYLRRILANLLRDESRRAARQPEMVPVDEHVVHNGTSPSERFSYRELLRAYSRALDQMPEPQRSAVVLRIEHGLRYEAIAERLGLASPDAARMAARRALDRLIRDHR